MMEIRWRKVGCAVYLWADLQLVEGIYFEKNFWFFEVGFFVFGLILVNILINDLNKVKEESLFNL